MPPSVHPNAHAINEIMTIFHEFINLKKIKGWKHLHKNMTRVKLISMVFEPLLRNLRLMESDENCLSYNNLNDSVLVLRRGRPRILPTKETTPRMNKAVHSHRSMMTDPIKDAELALHFAMNQRANDNENDIIHDFGSPSDSTVANHADLSASNDPSLGPYNTSSSRLKILNRIIASKSARSLCSHVPMSITT